jgi:alkylation response protein AidB-like acyl-CoA dehydrogenase
VTIARFRQRHQLALAEALVDSLRLCAEAGMVKLRTVILDGTKIEANASADASRTLADIEPAMHLLLYTTAAAGDSAHSHPDPGQGEAAQRTVDLLTPIAKAWCTDTGFRLASVALQVHGGAGHVEETGVAQLLRDSRIGPIYEGTNGIQAIDLVTRKIAGDDARGLWQLLPCITATAAEVGAACETRLREVAHRCSTPPTTSARPASGS